MTVTNSSTKAIGKKKRNPIVQVVLQPAAHKQFVQRCKDEDRSESSMGAILIAQGLNSAPTSTDATPNTNAL